MDVELQKRGMLTTRIREKSKSLLGYEIDTAELRLMPYIMHVMINDQSIDIFRIDEKERVVLSKWRDAGHIDGGAGGMQITEKFWTIICEIVWLGYVDIQE
jgi:hypothetical protein